jgi:hypothetical protein
MEVSFSINEQPLRFFDDMVKNYEETEKRDFIYMKPDVHYFFKKNKNL